MYFCENEIFQSGDINEGAIDPVRYNQNQIWILNPTPETMWF